MANSSIHLKDLLAPTASGVLDRGSVFKDDRQLSLWLFAQDAFGWQNWLTARHVPFEGDANEMLYEAGDKLLFSRAETDEVFATAGTDRAIPACVYKGDEDESIDFNGDVVAWGHLFNLEPSTVGYCPPDVRATVGEHIDRYWEIFPKEKSAQPTRDKDRRFGDSVAGAATNEWAVDEVLQKVKIPERAVSPDLSQADSAVQLDRNLAQLGREIVGRIGEEQDGQRHVHGKVKYRISINLADNTMRIYARDRGEEPILVDANGNIDHANSQVLPEDVRRFQVMVDDLRAYQQHTEPKKTAQIEA